MGLDYLNKKVWHPGSMKNIQKVWDAQQTELQVIKRQKQRAKKLLDEQYNEEMKRIQVQAGLIPRSYLDRMDWMYDWGNKIQQQKNNEDFLTGNKTAKKQYKHVFQEEATNKKCEDFVLVHEDPLFLIQKEEMKARESIMNNPIQMRNIIQEVQEDYIRKLKPHKEQERDKKKKKHKKQKKEKKDKRQKDVGIKYEEDRVKYERSRKRSPSSSSSSSSSSSERSRDKKPTKQKKLYQNYLKSSFGNILKQVDGKLVPDYGIHKKKYRTQLQLNEDERREKLNQLREKAKLFKVKRQRSPTPDQSRSGHGYQDGLSRIKQKSFDSYYKTK